MLKVFFLLCLFSSETDIFCFMGCSNQCGTVQTAGSKLLPVEKQNLTDCDGIRSVTFCKVKFLYSPHAYGIVPVCFSAVRDKACVDVHLSAPGSRTAVFLQHKTKWWKRSVVLAEYMYLYGNALYLVFSISFSAFSVNLCEKHGFVA